MTERPTDEERDFEVELHEAGLRTGYFTALPREHDAPVLVEVGSVSADRALMLDASLEIHRMRSLLQRYEKALREIASEHDSVQRDPVEHCTNLVRIAHQALTPPEES